MSSPEGLPPTNLRRHPPLSCAAGRLPPFGTIASQLPLPSPLARHSHLFCPPPPLVSRQVCRGVTFATVVSSRSPCLPLVTATTLIVGIDIVRVAVNLTAVAAAPAVIVTIKRRRIPSVRLRKASSRRRIMGQHRHICRTPPPLLPTPPLLTRYSSESFSPGCRVRHDQQRVRPP